MNLEFVLHTPTEWRCSLKDTCCLYKHYVCTSLNMTAWDNESPDHDSTHPQSIRFFAHVHPILCHIQSQNWANKRKTKQYVIDGAHIWSVSFLSFTYPLKNLLSTVLLQVDLHIGKRGQDWSNLKVSQTRANQQVKLTPPPPAICFLVWPLLPNHVGVQAYYSIWWHSRTHTHTHTHTR